MTTTADLDLPPLPDPEEVTKAVRDMLNGLGYFVGGSAYGSSEAVIDRREALARLIAEALPARVTAAGIAVREAEDPMPFDQLRALQGVDACLLVHLLADEEWIEDHPTSAELVREDRARLHAAFPRVGSWSE